MVSEQGIKISNLERFDHIVFILFHFLNVKNIRSGHDMSKFYGVEKFGS